MKRPVGVAVLPLALALCAAPAVARVASPPGVQWVADVTPDPATSYPVNSVHRLADGSVLVVESMFFAGVSATHLDAAGAVLSTHELPLPDVYDGSLRISVDPSGAVFVGITTTPRPLGAWVMKFDGLTGLPLWAGPFHYRPDPLTDTLFRSMALDAHGNLFVRGPSETPQWGPGAISDPARDGDAGSLPLTIGKMRAMNAKSSFSSQRPGHEAAYAVDNSTGTWWEPAENDAQPSITVDLGPATEFDPLQAFTVDSSRILFATGRTGFGFGAAQPAAAPAPPGAVVAHQYKIEASSDGTTFTTILDKTQNGVTKYVEFDELPPTTCRFIRLTITGWPRRESAPLGIVEFTVFGKAAEPAKM